MNDAIGLVNITDRRKLELTGVMSLDSFDEYAITVTVSCGKLMIEGEGINITVLDLEKGVVAAEGRFNSAVYSDNMGKNEKGIIGRIFGGRK